MASKIDPEMMIKNLQVISMRYDDTFYPFFDTLSNSYVGIKDSKEVDLVVLTRTTIRQFTVEVDKLLKSIEPKETIESLKKAAELASKVDDSIRQLKSMSKQPMDKSCLGIRIKNAEADTGISFDEITKTSAMIKGRVDALSKSSSILSPLGKIGAELGGDLYSGLLNTLGPFAGIAKLASQAIGTHISGGNQEKQTLANRAFAGRMLPQGDRNPDSIRDMYNTLFGSGRVDVKKETQGYSENAGPWMGDKDYSKNQNDWASEAGGFGRRSRSSRSYRRGKKSGNRENPYQTAGEKPGVATMREFFSGPAYKTKWTAELLEAVQGKKGGKTVGEEAKSAFNWATVAWEAAIASMLPFVGIIVTATIAVLASSLLNLIGKFLQKDELKKQGFREGPELERHVEELPMPFANSAGISDPMQAQRMIDMLKMREADRKAQSVEKIPVVNKESILITEQKKQNDEIVNQLKVLNDSVKKSKETQPVPMTSTKDVHDVRHPLLAEMNAGQIEVY